MKSGANDMWGLTSNARVCFVVVCVVECLHMRATTFMDAYIIYHIRCMCKNNIVLHITGVEGGEGNKWWPIGQTSVTCMPA
jgi:hypothetical protein